MSQSHAIAGSAATDRDRWGPMITAPGRAVFRLWAPDMDRLVLELEDEPPAPMQREAGGWFNLEVPARAGTRYRFRLPDGRTVPDPASRRQSGGMHGWSVLTDPEGYVWRHGDWRGRPWHEAVVYELHVGLCGGFAGVMPRLAELRALGVTALQLMPVADFAGNRNWGYDGVLPYAPAEAYGPPEALKTLIDEAHGHGLMVYLDVVYNHFGPDGNYLGAYAADFFDAGADTPWGAAVAVHRRPVSRYFIDNALMWLQEFRFDGLRFDAVHAIGDTNFLDAMAAELRAALPERPIHLILENETNDAERLTEAFDAQWNDDFHNVMHVLLTGESIGYYGDFVEAPAAKLARCLAEGFIYQGETSPNHPDIPRGRPSGHLPPTSFVNFLQNHDQVGNRAMGERLILLTDAARLRAAVALMLLGPAVPLLFMGEEAGARAPFLFFTDFQNELAEAVREGRRQEFAKFPDFSNPERRAAIPDPNAESTFAASRSEPGFDQNDWRAYYTELLALRRERIVPHLSGAQALGAGVVGDAAVRASWRLGNGRHLTLIVNLGAGQVSGGDYPETSPVFATGDAMVGPGLTAWIEP